MRKIALFFVLFISLFSLASFAQDNSKWKDFHIRLGNVNMGAATGTATATIAQILAMPKLVTTLPGCVVKSFSFSLNKGGDIYGPFYTKGNELTGDEIALIKKLKGSNVKITIENIKATDTDGTLRSFSDLALTYNN